MLHDQSDLQATQQIIELFERSKSQSEEALESLPGVYAVIDINGMILKGNKCLAKLFDTNYENLLSLGLQRLFSRESWHQFSTQLYKLKDLGGSGIEFQADIETGDGVSKNYLWYVNSLQLDRTDLPKLFWVLGRDVTELNRATATNARMQMELTTAKTVQDSLFPSPSASFGQSSISGHYESATECGGDWWYYCMMGDKLFLWIGDVTGHGVAAALITSAVHSAVSIIEGSVVTPAQAMTIVSRAVSATGKGQKSMTFCIASIDLKTGECTYTSASHELAFILPNHIKEYDPRNLRVLLAEASKPLGSPNSFPYKEQKFQLNRGDRLFFFTDGINDVNNQSGDVWGSAKFRRALASQATRFRGAQDLVQGIQHSISDFRAGAPLYDDVTFFVFKL